MSTFILKFILCSGVLFGAYQFILRTEKTLHFNRFFLLSILGLSLWFPTLITKTEYVKIPVQEVTYIEEGQYTPQVFEPIAIEPIAEPITISTIDVLWSLYGLVSVFFLIRFCRNLWQINRLRKEGTLIAHRGLSFCLRSDIHASFTFLNTIYANKEQFESGELPQDIITHESIHVQQRHSIDIILMELMQCFLWFNPLLYLIKSAIKLNHEYLADEQVCAGRQEISTYQKTLIQYVYNSTQQPVLASQLTYGQTKNRLNMMVNKLHKPKALAKLVLTLGIASLALWGFGETEVVAQQIEQPSQDVPTITNSKGEEIPLTIISLNDKVKVKFLSESAEWIEKLYGELIKEELERFKKEESQGQFYIEKLAPLIPNDKLLEDFKDPDKYGIWIDNSPIANEKLENYTQKDFHHYTISKLLVGATNYGKHEYQVDLITWSTYESSPYSKGGWRLYWDVIREAKKGFEEIKKDKEDTEIDSAKIKQKQDLLRPTSQYFDDGVDPIVKFLNGKNEWVEKKYSDLDVAEIRLIFDKYEGHNVFIKAPHIGRFGPNPENYDLLKNNNIWLDNKKIVGTEITKEFYLDEISHMTFGASAPWQADYKVGTKNIFLYTWAMKDSKTPEQVGWQHMLASLGSTAKVFNKNPSDTIKKDKEDTEIDSAKINQKQDLPPPPPPRVVKLVDNSIVQYQRETGSSTLEQFGKLSKEQLERFRSPEGKGQVLLPPPPPVMITQEFFDQFKNGTYKVWVDNKKISLTTLQTYKPSDFYLYYEQLSVDENGERKMTGIQFFTKENFNTDEKWIPYNKLFEENVGKDIEEKVKEENKKFLNNRAGNTTILPKGGVVLDQNRDLEFYGFNELKYFNEQGRLIKTTLSNMTMNEKKWFRTPEAKGSYLSSISTSNLTHFINKMEVNNPQKYVVKLNGKTIPASEITPEDLKIVIQYELRNISDEDPQKGSFNLYNLKYYQGKSKNFTHWYPIIYTDK